MDKAKTSKKQKKSVKGSLKAFDTDDASFADKKLIKEILIEALMEDDLETFQDVLIAHLRACPKSELAKRSGVGRRTLYDLIDKQKEFNPRLSTLGAILKAIPA